MITRLLALALFAAAPALASSSELEVPVGVRAQVKSKKAISQIVVRDPSLLSVTVSSGTVSMEGKESGVTSVTVTYADGAIEKKLVVVGDGLSSGGMSSEQAETVTLD